MTPPYVLGTAKTLVVVSVAAWSLSRETERMQTILRIAVLGLFNSGTTALAGVMHRLGVDMGAPFWGNSDDNSPQNYYEPRDLSRHLRSWWNEPQLQETVDRSSRIAYLTNWIRLRELMHPGPVGAKHPLLSLCADDLVTAWGAGTVFLRACRPLDESIKRLKVRNWFPNHEEWLQRQLWQALERFCDRQLHLSVEYRRLRNDTACVIEEVAAFAHLSPTTSQLTAAQAFVARA